MDIFLKDNKILHSLIKTAMTIILSAALGSTFISLLYFTLGNYVEELMVVKNIKYILDKFCILNDPIVKNNLNPIVSKLEAPPVNQNDKIVIDQQNNIKSQALHFYGKINIIVIFSILMLSCIFNISLMPIIIRSLTLLLGIAIVEVFFLCFVTYNFIMAQPNKTFTQMLNAPQLQINLDNETREPSIVSELSNNSSLFRTEYITPVSNFI
jgi:hypothetical protein